MGLIITRNDSTFTVEGELNSVTASKFKTHFNITLNCLKGLTINVEKINEIDSSGIKALKSIYLNALKWNKPFYIVGTGCKEIYDDLKIGKA